MYFIAILINIILTINIFWDEKQNSKWLKEAKIAYDEDKNTLFYPKSEVALRKKHHLYASVALRNVIGSWLITFIFLFWFYNEKIFLIVYICNYIYGRILFYFALIEQKIEIIKEEVYKENECL